MKCYSKFNYLDFNIKKMVIKTTSKIINLAKNVDRALPKVSRAVWKTVVNTARNKADRSIDNYIWAVEKERAATWPISKRITSAKANRAYRTMMKANSTYNTVKSAVERKTALAKSKR